MKCHAKLQIDNLMSSQELLIEPITRARDLGVILESGLDMQYHVRNKCKSAAMGLHKIGKIRKYLDRGFMKTEKQKNLFMHYNLSLR